MSQGASLMDLDHPPTPDPITDHPTPSKSYLWPIFSTKSIIGVGGITGVEGIMGVADAPMDLDHPTPSKSFMPIIFNKNHHGGGGIMGCWGASQGGGRHPCDDPHGSGPPPSKSYLCPIFSKKTIMGASWGWEHNGGHQTPPVMPPMDMDHPPTPRPYHRPPPLKIIFMQYILCQNLIPLTGSTSNIDIYLSTLVFVENTGNFLKFVKIKNAVSL